jgi:hypothetical protein
MSEVEYRESPVYSGYLIGSNGTAIGRAGHLLKPNGDGAGYLKMVMCLPGNLRKTVRVHRLVCEAFHGPPPSPQHVVAHADGDRQNNRADNLRWATYVENEADKRAHGRTIRGERQGFARLTEQGVRDIRRRVAEGEPRRKLAAIYGVSKATLQHAITGRTWGHVS